jgi:hypothetical protein
VVPSSALSCSSVFRAPVSYTSGPKRSLSLESIRPCGITEPDVQVSLPPRMPEGLVVAGAITVGTGLLIWGDPLLQDPAAKSMVLA